MNEYIIVYYSVGHMWSDGSNCASLTEICREFFKWMREFTPYAEYALTRGSRGWTVRVDGELDFPGAFSATGAMPDEILRRLRETGLLQVA